MDHDAPDNVLVLVRAAPATPAAEKARRAIQRLVRIGDVAISVFFHGDGVVAAASGRSADWHADDEHPARLMVCQAAWQRRFSGPVADGFEISSLVQFWHLAGQSYRILSFGGGDGG